jgi:uncharacterized peroxidase-related enzyme
MTTHAAVAAELLGEAVVHGALEDLEASALPPPEKALLRFTAKVNSEAHAVGPGDIEALHAHGWSDEAIYDAILVCALFNFYNRWIDANGVCGMPEAATRASGRRLAKGGYAPDE